MKIGFTGTRNGLKRAQDHALFVFLKDIFESNTPPEEFHHGDCVGADDEAANMVHELKQWREQRTNRLPECDVHCHPPSDDKLRAFNKHHNHLLPPKTHFARNRDIVDACDVLIGCPGAPTWQKMGGTFYTMDYAIKKKKRVVVIWPDGTVEEKA